jgi:hypothetical protein
MPGHMIEAACACGFTKELSPGLNDSGPITEHEMAYTEADGDLDTFERSEIVSRNLKMLGDPFLDDEEDALADELSANLESTGKPRGPYHCPGCKQNSLFLTFSGVWD